MKKMGYNTNLLLGRHVNVYKGHVMVRVCVRVSLSSLLASFYADYPHTRTTTLTNDHPSHTTTFRVTDNAFCLNRNPSRATIPLIRPHQCDSDGGRIRGVLL